MDRHSIVLRTAEPTYEDGLACARYADDAAEGFFRLWLGPRAAHIIATAFSQPDHDLSYQNAVFAERANVIVGMFLGYTAEQKRRNSREALKQAARPGILRMWLVGMLFAPLMRITDSIADGDFYLQTIAVDPELRGEGVGSRLMDASEERARASGSTRLALDVSAGNTGACRFYEHRGMSIESRWPRRLPIPALKFYRMAKVL